jgi:hypothetical protein
MSSALYIKRLITYSLINLREAVGRVQHEQSREVWEQKAKREIKILFHSRLQIPFVN